MNIAEIQDALRDEGLDGWLFFDHHKRDPLAYRVLQLETRQQPTRRWYYLIPTTGEPRGLVHRIESTILDELPGSKAPYSGWMEQQQALAQLLSGCRKIAMQYSPKCAVPYVSMVDAGTIELVKDLGIEVVSSDNLIQYFEARWDQAKLESHLEAGRRVDAIRRAAFQRIGDALRSNQTISEFDVKQFILNQFRENALFTDHGPIVGVNRNSSDPHFEPTDSNSSPIRSGDWVLIDMWAKLDRPGSVYYDITWTGHCGASVPSDRENIFSVVREARDRAIGFVKKAVETGTPICGFQVDDVARGYIRERGFGENFFHRTGHSIGEDVHGAGANMDNLETHDTRRLIPWTCFSIEPGVYLPKFGVRSEVNVFIGDGAAQVTGEIQTHPVRILG